tara:strand:+ start:449 stop:670 length:222 start_codon:yes stop_codon:yes gene_type:complete
MAFKMKGSPMARNFGVGSPLHKDKKKTTKKDSRSWLSKADESIRDLGQKYSKSKAGKFMGKVDHLIATGKWKK